MNHASLFSGIGGFDLAAEWMGWTNVLHCERDPFCQRVLQYHFPNAKTYNDVKTFDGTEWRGRVDILTGGFPCQPYSSAGKRLGKDDERHLWPEMCRIISEVAPAYVVGENVRGLLNWNGGVVFEEVCSDLEAMGYEVWTGILPAAGVGAPHRRDRIWFVAYTESGRNDRRPGKLCEEKRGQNFREFTKFKQRGQVRSITDSEDIRCDPATSTERDAANAESAIGKRTRDSRSRRDGFADNCGHTDAANSDGNQRPEGRKHKVRPNKAARHVGSRDARPDTWQNFPTQPPICGGNDGLPRELDGVTFSKWRAESIKAYGNAIVPQVAYQIFQAIQTTHDN